MTKHVETAFDLTTQQGVFDHVATALLAQGKPAMTDDGNACKYEADNGCRCAIGHLIPAKRQREKANFDGEITEYTTVRSHAALRFLDKRIPRTLESKRLLSAMQSAHDNPALDEDPNWLRKWKYEMQQVAYDYGLSDAVVSA